MRYVAAAKRARNFFVPRCHCDTSKAECSRQLHIRLKVTRQRVEVTARQIERQRDKTRKREEGYEQDCILEE